MAAVAGALQGADERVLWERFEVLYGEGEFAVDEAVDGDAVAVGVEMRDWAVVSVIAAGLGYETAIC